MCECTRDDGVHDSREGRKEECEYRYRGKKHEKGRGKENENVWRAITYKELMIPAVDAMGEARRTPEFLSFYVRETSGEERVMPYI